MDPETTTRSRRPTFSNKYVVKAARKAQILVQAQLRITLETQVKVNRRYETLFYGLKKNHPHNCALIHPMAFLLRRIVYTMVIVFMFHKPFFGSMILLAISLSILGYVICESQWEDSLINQQHIVNEVALYICLVFVVLFCDTAVLQRS
jgi:hypothetical protein